MLAWADVCGRRLKQNFSLEMPMNSVRRRQSFLGPVTAKKAFQWSLEGLLQSKLRCLLATTSDNNNPTECVIPRTARQIHDSVSTFLNHQLQQVKPRYRQQAYYKNLPFGVGFRYCDNIF